MEYKPSTAQLGLNLDSTAKQIPQGMVSYALNAQVDNFNGEQITYQNEQANQFCVDFPDGYKVIGWHNIIEKEITIYFLYNPTTDNSEIGKVTNDSCTYEKIINAKCLNFNLNYPIHKAVHKISSCKTQIFWTDNLNPRRVLDLENLPFELLDNCPTDIFGEGVDCNKLLVQPDFVIPSIEIEEVDGLGTLSAGTYQFAIQYSDDRGDGYTSFYSVTNPTPIFDSQFITLDFNYKVNKSIKVKIENLDTSGYYEHFNLAVIKTVNDISTVDLVGTYDITSDKFTVFYTGQGVQERLTISDIFEKFPIYTKADDLTTAQDILIWKGLTSDERLNYQSIANEITLNWQTWKVPGDKTYADPLKATYLKGYMRDEVYPFEIVFLLDNGKQTDGFHIPGRAATSDDLVPILNDDTILGTEGECSPDPQPLPTWQVYNTGDVTNFEQVYLDYVNGITYPCAKCPPVVVTDPNKAECYTGPYQYGTFGYWESTETYPCDEIWGDLANKPIRHHRFPDSVVSHIHDNQGFVYPIGARVDVQQIMNLIETSDLTEEQKKKIQGFKIVRGNRINNKSVVAKGLINNVGKYQRDDTTYLFPNYPYNDLNADPFISSNSNAPSTDETPPEFTNIICYSYQITGDSTLPAVIYYTDCDGNSQATNVNVNETITICSRTTPTSSLNLSIIQTGICRIDVEDPEANQQDPTYLDGFDNDSKLRYTFHSPDTHFYQPNLGNILKLETAEFGKSKGHFREVKNHSKYKFISGNAFVTAITVGVAVGFASSTIGLSTNLFNGTAAFTSYQAFISIVDKVLPKKNFAYQYNSFGDYNDFRAVPNLGNKQRRLDISAYLSPGMINIGDDNTVNNFQRESSVYLRTTKQLPYTQTLAGVPEDVSRWTLSQEGCNREKTAEKDISSYYASIKRTVPNQYGQMYSYETIDTGFQFFNEPFTIVPERERIQSVFGGDIFINRFAYKTKLPFFIDNRVSTNSQTFPDDADISYNELGNIGNPNYWFSTDANQGTYNILGINLGPLFGVKAFNFDCDISKFFYNNGTIYLFAYGIPYFYCESEVNVDLRQAFNGKEGDFFPRVSNDIPDEWLQETNVTIQQDNTYHYNKTYSKQNKENFFSHLPADWLECEQEYSYRAIFSTQDNWFIYRGNAKFDFPQNYGKLISLEGIENRVVLARFENKSLLYNALLTAPTSAADVYLGQSLFSQQVPPLDFAETDIGYAGTQNKMFLKTEFGHISTDAKRGQVFVYSGNSTKDLTEKFVSKFYNEHLNFYIKKQFPDFPTDNHFNGLGLHGVYDSKYNRFILTKLDYECINSNITYSNGDFKLNGNTVQITDTQYFINRSFTMSYDFDIQNWVSFHSYIPNFYVPQNNYFYSSTQNGIWKHNVNYTEFNKFYGVIEPYALETPYAFNFNDEILQCIKDSSKVYKFEDNVTFTEIDDVFFNKLVISTNQQCSGVLSLVKKPKNKLSEYSKYPIYNSDNKEVLWTKSDNFYQVNTFWDMVKTPTSPIWKKSNTNLSVFKELNTSNLDYGKRSFRKGPLRGKDMKVRFILDDKSDTKIVSQILTISTQQSFK